MRLFLLCFVLFLSTISYSQILNHRNSKTAAIDSFVKKTIPLFHQYKKTFYSDEEKWEYYQKDSILVFNINYKIKNVIYNELYYLRSGNLACVNESEVYRYKTGTSVWACVFYFENDKLLYLESLGHGKSEDDRWRPESETIQQYKKRYSQLKKLMH